MVECKHASTYWDDVQTEFCSDCHANLGDGRASAALAAERAAHAKTREDAENVSYHLEKTQRERDAVRDEATALRERAERAEDRLFGSSAMDSLQTTCANLEAERDALRAELDEWKEAARIVCDADPLKPEPSPAHMRLVAGATRDSNRTLRARVAKMEGALCEAAIPLEVLFASDAHKPYREIGPDLREGIAKAVHAIRAALADAPGPS